MPLRWICLSLTSLLGLAHAADTARLVFTDGNERVVVVESIDAERVRCLVGWRDGQGQSLMPRSYALEHIAQVVPMPGADPFPAASTTLATSAPVAAAQPDGVTVLPDGAFQQWLVWDRRRRALIGELRLAHEALATAQLRQTRGLAAMVKEEDAMASAQAAIPDATLREQRQAQRASDAEAAFRSAEALYHGELLRVQRVAERLPGCPTSPECPVDSADGMDPTIVGIYRARWAQWAAADRSHADSRTVLRRLRERVATGERNLLTWAESRDALVAELTRLVEARAQAEAELDAWTRAEPPRRAPSAAVNE